MIDTAPKNQAGQSSLALWYLGSKALSALLNLVARSVAPKSQICLKVALIHLTDLRQVEARLGGDRKKAKVTCLRGRPGEGIK